MDIGIKFPAGVRPLLKHGNHDQSTHGHRGGGVVQSMTTDEAKQFLLGLEIDEKDEYQFWRKAFDAVAKKTGRDGKPTVKEFDGSEKNVMFRVFEGGAAYTREEQAIEEGSTERKIDMFLHADTPYLSGGRNGFGLYTAPSERMARFWGASGSVLKLGSAHKLRLASVEDKRSLDANLVPTLKELMKKNPMWDTHTTWGSLHNLSNLLLFAKGFDGLDRERADGENVIWSNSKLLVDKASLPDVNKTVVHRIHGDVKDLLKHLDGQHDQSTHGHRGVSVDAVMEDLHETLPSHMDYLRPEFELLQDATILAEVAKIRGDAADDASKIPAAIAKRYDEAVARRDEHTEFLVQYLEGRYRKERSYERFQSGIGWRPDEEAIAAALSEHRQEFAAMGNEEFGDYLHSATIDSARRNIEVHNGWLHGIGQSDLANEQAWDLDARASAEIAWSGLSDNGQRRLREFATELRVGVPAVQIPPATLVRVINDERFKSQFEGKRSGGLYNPARRAVHENANFGYPNDLNPEMRPIYGFMQGATEYSMVEQYGSATVKLKESVKSRMSVTADDSLGQDVFAIPVTGPLPKSGVLFGALFGRTSDAARDVIRRGDAALSERLAHSRKLMNSGWHYREIQVHGGLKVSDINQVNFTKPPAASVVRALKKAGIQFTVGAPLVIKEMFFKSPTDVRHILKHMQGQHDQSTHGRRGTGFAPPPVPPSVTEYFKQLDIMFAKPDDADETDEEYQDRLIAHDIAAQTVVDMYDDGSDHFEPDDVLDAMYARHKQLQKEKALSAKPEVQELAKHVQSYVDEADVVVALPASALGQVVTEGRFKSLFESGYSRGAYAPTMRKSQEAISNGLPWNIPDSERPIYGFMAESGGRHNKMTAQYGDFRVVMNDDVRDRTTFTIGDSLGGHGIAAPLSGASAGRIALSAANENLGALITAVPSAAVGFVNRRQYFEAQIHGGLKASDIKTIHISEKQFAMGGISTKVAQELSKMGFKVFVDSPSRGSVAVDEFDVAKGVTVKLPAGVKPVLKHGNHDQSTHGHRGHSLASKYEQERRTRTVIQGQQMHRDWQVAAVYRAEAEVRPPFDVSTRPKAPRRADFPNAGEYLAAFNEYEYAHNKWVLEQTTNVVSLTGGRHLNGTKKGIQAYVDEVIKSDWFVERFGDGSNMPPLKLSVRKLSGNTAGQHTLSYSSRRGVKHELAIDKQFINSEDTLMHELAHYAMAISTFGVEGHGAEFAGGHLFIVEKIAGPVYADRLRAAYKKNGVRH